MEERGITNLMFSNAMIWKGETLVGQLIVGQMQMASKWQENGPSTQRYSEYTM